ncbi:MAG: glycoside hydrolase family 99-like domain-containing protein, partial [Bacteroidetes bacterium]|nr:glycoside hydrolase family 99-like domain-containing protein [Bacteroidota bacterium]
MEEELIKFTNRKKIAIGLVEHMGDIVACEPVARHLRAEFPDAVLTWVVRSEYRELIDSNPNIDQTIVVTCLTEWILLTRSGVFDEIFDLHINGRVCPDCRIPLQKTKGNVDVAELTYFKYGSLLQAFSVGAGLPAINETPKVYISDSIVEKIDRMNLPEEFIVVHATSNESVKDWDISKWNELAAEISARYGVPIIEVGHKPVMEWSGRSTGRDLCGKLSILETAEVIRRASIFLGIDSGPAHLGNAVGTFGIILLGKYKVYESYNPFSGDYGTGLNSHLIFSQTRVSDIPVSQVMDVFDKCLLHVRQGRRFREVRTKYEADVRTARLRSRDEQKSRARAIAFYLPQFHPIEENNRWWGKGFTEWTNVAKAKPQFPGHVQPRVPAELGFYDLRLREVRNEQAALAREYGIEGFCYWHYWFDGKLLLEKPVEEVISSGEPDFPFCLAWANESWTRRWDGADKQILQTQTYGGDADDTNHFKWLLRAFKDRRYITVDGKPLFLIYRPADLPDPKRTIGLWRKLAGEEGIKGIYVIAIKSIFDNREKRWREFGFDGELIHHPNFGNLFELFNFKRNFILQRKYIPPAFKQEEKSFLFKFDYEDAVPYLKLHNDKYLTSDEVYPTVICSWDNSPRVGKRSTLLSNTSPAAYEKWVAVETERLAERDVEHRLLFINAWNEWAEGMFLEPDQALGRKLLEATRRGLRGVVREEKEKAYPVDVPVYEESLADRQVTSYAETHLKAARQKKGAEDYADAGLEYKTALALLRESYQDFIHGASAARLSEPEAKKVSAEVEKLKSSLAGLSGELAEVYIFHGDIEKADRTLLEALRFDKEAVVVSFKAAEMILSKGFLQSSLYLFLNLFDRNPKDVKVLLNLGMILARMGMTEKSIEAYESVLILQKNNRTAIEALKLLRDASRSSGENHQAPEQDDAYYGGSTRQTNITDKTDGKYEYLDSSVGSILAASSVGGDNGAVPDSKASDVFSFLKSIGPFYAHFGGAGDALLLLSTFYDREPESQIISITPSPAALRSLFDAFPRLRRVFFIPYPDSFSDHVTMRKTISQLPNFRGMGTTPVGPDYFTEWAAPLDIFEKYGVSKNPKWAAGFHPERMEQVQIVIHPVGGMSPLKKNTRKAFESSALDDLIAAMNSKGIKPILIGTPEDQAILSPKGSYMDRRSYSFEKQMEIIAACDLLIGADSWAKTFAALAGKPALVLHSTGMEKVAGREEVGDNVFLKPWHTITVARNNTELVSMAARMIESLTRGSSRIERADSVRQPADTEKLSVIWEGSQFVHHSMALINRELTLQLFRKGHDLSIIPYEQDEYDHRVDRRYAQIAKHVNKRLEHPTEVHVRHQWPPNLVPPADGHWVMIQPWEFGSIPKEWIRVMNESVDEVWVPSTYVRDCYVKSGLAPKYVAVVPNAVNTEKFSPWSKPYQLKTRKKFKFLFVGGTIARKGIDILLNAYVKSFTRNDDVCLVIKDMLGNSFYKGQTIEQDLKRISSDESLPEIEYINEKLSEEEVAGLYTAADCLVHPYRGEGFGFPIAEALASELPVIVTNYGAALDFCNEENAYLIPSKVMYYEEKKVGQRETVDAPWLAEPDQSAVGDLMRHVINSYDEAKEKAKRGRQLIAEKFSWEKVGNIAEERMLALRNRPVKRFESDFENDSRSKYNLAHELISSGDLKSAAKLLEELLDSDTDNVSAANDLAVVYSLHH